MKTETGSGLMGLTAVKDLQCPPAQLSIKWHEIIRDDHQRDQTHDSIKHPKWLKHKKTVSAE